MRNGSTGRWLGSPQSRNDDLAALPSSYLAERWTKIFDRSLLCKYLFCTNLSFCTVLLQIFRTGCFAVQADLQCIVSQWFTRQILEPMSQPWAENTDKKKELTTLVLCAINHYALGVEHCFMAFLPSEEIRNGPNTKRPSWKRKHPARHLPSIIKRPGITHALSANGFSS